MFVVQVPGKSTSIMFSGIPVKEQDRQDRILKALSCCLFVFRVLYTVSSSEVCTFQITNEQNCIYFRELLFMSMWT